MVKSKSTGQSSLQLSEVRAILLIANIAELFELGHGMNKYKLVLNLNLAKLSIKGQENL